MKAISWIQQGSKSFLHRPQTSPPAVSEQPLAPTHSCIQQRARGRGRGEQMCPWKPMVSPCDACSHSPGSKVNKNLITRVPRALFLSHSLPSSYKK